MWSLKKLIGKTSNYMVEINEVEFAWWLLRTGVIQCCEVNGRVEREIETVRGLARTLISHLKNGAKSEINTYGPIFQWAMRHAGWLLTYFRRKAGSPTAYEMTTGRKYVGKLAVFGERVLARLPTANDEDKFKVGAWIGKTDRGDFHGCYD